MSGNGFFLMAFFMGSLLDDRLKILEHGGQSLFVLAGIEAVDGMERIGKLAGQGIQQLPLEAVAVQGIAFNGSRLFNQLAG